MPFEITTTPQGPMYQLTGSAHKFHLSDGGPGDYDPRRVPFDKALRAVGDFHDLHQTVDADKDLSVVGKSKRLETGRAALVRALAGAGADLDAIDTDIARAEAEMLTLPTVAPEMAAATATREAAIVGWWAKLDTRGKAQALQTMIAEPAQHHEAMQAVMRQPSIMADPLSDQVAKIWREYRRASEPAKVASLDEGRRAVEWSRAGLANLVGISNRFLGWNGQQVLGSIVAANDDRALKGLGVFGFDRSDADLARAQIAAKKTGETLMGVTT